VQQSHEDAGGVRADPVNLLTRLLGHMTHDLLTDAGLDQLWLLPPQQERQVHQTGHGGLTDPCAHVPTAVGGVVVQTAQQGAVNLGDVLFTHNLVWGPSCSHANRLANPEIIKNA